MIYLHAADVLSNTVSTYQCLKSLSKRLLDITLA